ncbi:hypothetical protein MES5069_530016 [Mesorhizobium escarrei]|uniref:Uncharacterized protein n=1 Tax=Mesorhizobium escarrei TaxID=666018 RepID=A0ABN8KAV2_9HYPH|nr:hypothetical protein MES5069_530016 [Mesorhizobium escarrei]
MRDRGNVRSQIGLRSYAIPAIDVERKLIKEVDDACESHSGGGKPRNRDQCGKPAFSGARL